MLQKIVTRLVDWLRKSDYVIIEEDEPHKWAIIDVDAILNPIEMKVSGLSYYGNPSFHSRLFYKWSNVTDVVLHSAVITNNNFFDDIDVSKPFNIVIDVDARQKDISVLMDDDGDCRIIAYEIIGTIARFAQDRYTSEDKHPITKMFYDSFENAVVKNMHISFGSGIHFFHDRHKSRTVREEIEDHCRANPGANSVKFFKEFFGEPVNKALEEKIRIEKTVYHTWCLWSKHLEVNSFWRRLEKAKQDEASKKQDELQTYSWRQ